MDLIVFLESGLLELFVIGALSQDEVLLVRKMQELHPEVREEIDSLEKFYEQNAVQNELKPQSRTDKKMNFLLDNLELEQRMQLSEIPLISGFSDSEAWMKMVTPLFPTEIVGERFERLLRNENGIMQMLVISKTDIDEEIHDDLEESFLILEGTCICTVGDISREMGRGEFMQIPLFESHTVNVTSKTVTAILQRVDCDR